MRSPRSARRLCHLGAAIVTTAFVVSMVPALAVVNAPWISTDIGAVGLAGSADFADGVFTVRGAGADIWGSADSFHFVSQPMSGDVEIVARVVSIQNTHAYAKAGVMLRGALTAHAAHVILDVKPGGGIEFMARSVTGGSTTYLAGASAAAPVWLRLVRSGSTVTGSWSADGSSWAEVGRTTISLPSTVHAGLPVTSHNTSVLNSSTFDNVSVVGTPVNLPPSTTLRRLRVMTWNVNAGRTRDGSAGVDAQVSLMARSGAHVIVLQEVTIEPGADLPTLYEAQLEGATGQPWNAVWAEEPRPAPAVPQGNLVLSRLPLGNVETISLDGAPQDASALDAKRSAARIGLVINGVPVTLVTTMLASDGASRQVQIDQLRSWMSGVAQPRLLGGSLNMRPTDPGYSDLATSFADVWRTLVTTPDSGTTTEAFGSPPAPARVDGWWQEITGGSARATEVWIVKSSRSDHHAVVAEVEVR